MAVASPANSALKIKVFISYARKDLEFTDAIVAALKARGLEVLIDRRDLPLLEKFQGELLGFIRQADAAVFIVSEAAIVSEWCQWEVDRVAALNKRLAPIVLEAVDPRRLPKALEEINLLFFTPPHDFAAQADRLADALQTNIAWVKEHTRLGNLALRWQERQRSRILLLRGGELEEAEKWILAKPKVAPDPTDLHRAFIDAGRIGEKKRRRQQVALAASAAVVATGLAGVALWFQQEAVVQRDFAQVNEQRAVEQEAIAVEQRTIAEKNEAQAQAALRDAQLNLSMFRAEKSEALFRENQKTTAMLLALESLPDRTSSLPERRNWPITVQAQAALEKSLREGQEKRTLYGHEAPVYDIRFSPDGKRLLSSSFDGTRLWDAATGNLIAQLPGTGLQSVAAFSPDGKTIVTGVEDNVGGLLWDGVTGKALGRVRFASQADYTGAFNQNEAQGMDIDGAGQVGIYRDGYTGRVDIWRGDLWTGELTRIKGYKLPIAGSTGTRRVAATLHPRGRFGLTAHGNKLTVWDTVSGERIGEIGRFKGQIISVQLTGDGSQLGVATREGSIYILPVGETGPTGSDPSRHKIFEESYALSSAKFDPHGKRFAIVVEQQGVLLFDVGNKERVKSVGPTHALWSEFSPDGRLIASASAEEVIVSDTSTGERVARFANPKTAIASIAFGPDSATLATGTQAGEVNTWDLSRAGAAGAPKFAAGDCRRIMWLDGQSELGQERDLNEKVETKETLARVIAGIGTEEPYTQRDSRQSLLYSGQEGQYKNVAIASDLIATTGAGKRREVTWTEDILLWDRRSGELRHRIESAHIGRIHGLVFSPDAKLLMSYGDDNLVKLWDMADFRQVGQFQGHSDMVFGRCFSHDGQRAASMTLKELTLWDVASRQPLQQFPLTLEAWYLAFSDDDRYLIVGGDATEIDAAEQHPTQAFPISGDIQAEIDRARVKAPSCLTPPQREQFLLNADPPEWCIEMRKPPYNTEQWQQWLSVRRKAAN